MYQIIIEALCFTTNNCRVLQHSKEQIDSITVSTTELDATKEKVQQYENILKEMEVNTAFSFTNNLV